MNKNITVKDENRNGLRYVAKLIEIVCPGAINPSTSSPHIKHSPMPSRITVISILETQGGSKWNCVPRGKLRP